MLELVTQTLAEGNSLGRNVLVGGKSSEEEQQRESIIKVTQSIDEGGIALLDNMVEGELGGVVLLEARSVADFTTTQRPSDLLRKSLLFTELVQQRLVKQILDILGVVEGCVGGRSLRGLLLVARLTRINSFSITDPISFTVAFPSHKAVPTYP